MLGGSSPAAHHPDGTVFRHFPRTTRTSLATGLSRPREVVWSVAGAEAGLLESIVSANHARFGCAARRRVGTKRTGVIQHAGLPVYFGRSAFGENADPRWHLLMGHARRSKGTAVDDAGHVGAGSRVAELNLALRASWVGHLGRLVALVGGARTPLANRGGTLESAE